MFHANSERLETCSAADSKLCNSVLQREKDTQHSKIIIYYYFAAKYSHAVMAFVKVLPAFIRINCYINNILSSYSTTWMSKSLTKKGPSFALSEV